ncbi:FUSC family protein [Roseibium sp. SCPC15]|uniref:FUSC family protein n=1 Tax=Roseibium sp. SCP15 TaxID=3141376 RepID=UPI00333AB962
MLQLVMRSLTGLQRYDPGALRLVRGVDMTLTIVASVLLTLQLARFFQPAASGFDLAVIAAGAGSGVLVFTPVSTRRQEASDILWLGAILTVSFAIGAGVIALFRETAIPVLQVLWIAVIAIGFGMDGLGPFWLRAGRLLAIFWIFVVVASKPVAPGLWLPAMGVLGTATAFVFRILLWRPSPEKTFVRVERTNRKVMAEYLLQAASGGISGFSSRKMNLSQLTVLRAELETCAQLVDPKSGLKVLSPEAAAMIQLALEVVRGAVAALSDQCRADLTEGAFYRETVRNLTDSLETGEQISAKPVLETVWSRPLADLSGDDQFHLLRIVQAFQRLWLLAQATESVPSGQRGFGGSASSRWWKKISWELALQASAAAAVCYGLGAYFGLSHIYWITVTVVVVMCASLGATVKKTVLRTVGTAVGVFIALAVEPVLAELPEIRLILVILLLPPIVVFLERNYGIASGIISFVVLIGLQALTGMPVAEFWPRIYDTLIGAAAGLLAAWVLLPRRSSDSVHRLAIDYITSCFDYLKGEGRSEQEEKMEYAHLKSAANGLVTAAQDYRAEQSPWASFATSMDELDIMVLVLADYVVLYRQARMTIVTEVGSNDFDPPLSPIVARLDKRMLDEFEAVLEGREKQSVPGLIEQWTDMVPLVGTRGTQFMTDWVAMLYYARKIVGCLDGLKRDKKWSSALALDQ